jgi:hypothetical protein
MPYPRKSKYRNVATVIDGHRFASKAEAARYSELKLLQASGQVRWFIRQPRFDLPDGITYVADFLVVWCADELSFEPGQVTVEDVKGVETDVFKLKRKLFESRYGHLTIISKGRKLTRPEAQHDG